MQNIFNTDAVLLAYLNGYFPMADSESNQIHWHFPDPRAVFDIYNISIPRSVRKLYKSGKYKITVDNDFYSVIKHCSDRVITWINEEIIEVYCELHRLGFAHSIEVYTLDNKLVGGLYGVAIGGAFFGESMFNTEPNTAKLAFVKLIEILQANKFILLDSQYINNFTAQLGAIEIPAQKYLKILRYAVSLDCEFKNI